MKNIFIPALSILILTAGCASTTPAKVSTKDAAAVPALASAAYMSTRTTPTPAPENCPASEKSWRKESTRALENLANVCARLGKADRVNQMGQLLAQKEPNSPWGAFYMSVAAEQMKELPRALWMIELAIKKSPRTAILYYQKGRVHWALGEWSHAIDDYNLAIKENPRFVDAQLFLAQLYFRDQDFSKATQHFLTVIEIEPNNLAAVVGMAETKILQGKHKEAVEFYEQAVSLSPHNIQYRMKLADLYENTQKDYAQALSTYKRLQTLLSEARTPAADTKANVDEKVKRLEGLVAAAAPTASKVTKSESPQNKKVKK